MKELWNFFWPLALGLGFTAMFISDFKSGVSGWTPLHSVRRDKQPVSYWIAITVIGLGGISGLFLTVSNIWTWIH